MRAAFLTCLLSTLIAVSNADAQDQPQLAGFRYLRIHPVQMLAGSQPANVTRLTAYFEEHLVKRDWLILSGSEDLWGPGERETASQMLDCEMRIDDDGWGAGAFLTCFDAIGLQVLDISERGVALSAGGEYEAAIRHVVERLEEMRPRFEPDQAIDIVSRLPPVDMYSLTEMELDQIILDGRLTSAIEGLWAATDESGYRDRLGIVSVDEGREFVAVVLESPGSYVWQPGMVKARFTAAADGRTFSAKWRTTDRRETTGLASLTDSTLAVSVGRSGNLDTFTLLKLRPSVVSGSPAISTSGTGFFCAPGIVATNAHVIDGATAVEMYLPVQQRSVKLRLLVLDASNDLALLRVIDEDVASLPPALPLADSSVAMLGSSAFVIGFPLGGLLGSDHKVTDGVVSGLEGIGGDPTMFQLTAPVQPGSSGSPLFDTAGHVIGVVNSTYDTMAAVRESGQAPQNVNFAIKSDYLALLLRGVSNPGDPTTAVTPSPLQVPELIEKVRASVGQIKVYR